MRLPVILFFLVSSLLIGTEVVGQSIPMPVADYTFENGLVVDNTGNTELFLRNSAGLVDDPARGKVLHFSSSDKSYAVFNSQLLYSDRSTISFYFYWEEVGAGSWHQLFEIFNTQSGSNIFFTPQNGWGGNECSLISDFSEYNIYEAVSAQQLPKNQWIHLSVTFFGKIVTLYVDGQLAFEREMTITPGTMPGDSLFLGGNPYRTDNYYISARLDDIKIYDQTLAANQVKALAQGKVLPAPLNFGTVWEPVGETLQLTIDFEDEKQTIQNFGASDGWNTDRIGKYWPLNKKEELAELLFSTERDTEGNPKGIGLSAWRFNIGAGTAEQGDASRISNESRRTEGFLNTDGSSYNWNKQVGQQWFLKKAATTYNIHHLIGWQNSPPVPFTKNNLGFREFGAPMSTILEQEHFNDFARFLADVVEHFDSEGVHFDYISPLNEPQYGWAPTEVGGSVSQEGTPWTNQEIHDVVAAIDAEFSERSVHTKLFITEAASIDHHLRGSGQASNQLSHFWDQNASLSLAGKPFFSNIVSYHSYWVDHGSALINERKELFNRAQLLNPVPELWQTEYSLLGVGYREGYPEGYILTEMECALSLAKVILADLNTANVTGWQWWTTFERGKHWGESRFSLIEAFTQSDNSDGFYHLNKLFYSFGNFSHFIRPGMRRIGTKRSDNLTALEETSDVVFSAYTNSEDNEMVLVAANHTEFARSVSLSIEAGSEKQINNPSLFLTDKFNNLEKQTLDLSSNKLIIPAKSVVTYTAELISGTSVENVIKKDGFEVYLNADNRTVVVAFGPESSYQLLTLHNVSGKAVVVQNIQNGQNRIVLSASGVPAGVYIVTASGRGFHTSEKVVLP
jgi:O-glycosyl hydrolase